MPYKKLKDKAFDWVAKSYNNSNFVTRINEDDKILTKGSFDVPATLKDIPMNKDMMMNVKVDYDLDLEFKDGRYKVEINNLDLESGSIAYYFMTYDEFKKASIESAENYDGPGKKAYLKSVQNDKKMERTFNRNKDYWAQIIDYTMDYISNLEQSLHSYMKSDQEDDW